MTAARIKQLQILEAGEEHIDEVAALFDAYRVFYKQPSDPAGARLFVLDRIREKDSVVYLARGELDGAVVPLGFAQLYPSHSSVSMKRLWILNDLYVDVKGRKRGVGRALVDRARQLAIDTQAKGLILETAIDNAPAQALYDSYGFVRDTEFCSYELDV
jgi:ribosomal protein S18 acetylase RimI-like enzyme